MTVAVRIGTKVYGTFPSRAKALEHCAKHGLRFPPDVIPVKAGKRTRSVTDLIKPYKPFHEPINFHLE